MRKTLFFSIKVDKSGSKKIGVADELLVHYRGGVPVGKSMRRGGHVGTWNLELGSWKPRDLKGMRFKTKKWYSIYIYEEQGCTRAADEVEAIYSLIN